MKNIIEYINEKLVYDDKLVNTIMDEIKTNLCLREFEEEAGYGEMFEPIKNWVINNYIKKYDKSKLIYVMDESMAEELGLEDICDTSEKSIEYCENEIEKHGKEIYDSCDSAQIIIMASKKVLHIDNGGYCLSYIMIK